MRKYSKLLMDTKLRHDYFTYEEDVIVLIR